MADIIILIGVVLLSVVGLKTVISHTKGEGSGCCNTSSKPLEIKKKHNGKIVSKMIFEITGMSCEHCRIRVQNELNGIDGAVAYVNLKKGRGILECEKEINEETVVQCVEKIGYHARLISQ